MQFNISCQKAARLVSQQLDQPLSLADKLRLQAHLLICKACPTVHEKFVTLHQVGMKYAARDQGGGLSPQAKARIADRLREHGNASQARNRD